MVPGNKAGGPGQCWSQGEQMRYLWRYAVPLVAVTGMECCWLYAILSLLNTKVASGGLTLAWLILLHPLALGINISLQRLRWHKFFIAVISWLAWVVIMFLSAKVQLFADSGIFDITWIMAVLRAVPEVIYSFKPELLIMLGTGVIWWLTRRLSLRKVGFSLLISEFQFGLIMLAIAFMGASMTEVNISSLASIPPVFIFLSLLGMSVTNAAEGTGWLTGLLRGRWVILLLFSISLAILLGLLVSVAVTPDLLQRLLDAARWLGGLVWGLVVKVMMFIASLFPEPGPVELPTGTPLPDVESTKGFGFQLPELLRAILRLGWLVIFFGLFLFGMWRVSCDIFNWMRRRLAGREGVEAEPLQGAFRADIMGFLKRVFRWLLRLKLPFYRSRKIHPDSPEVAAVRRLYRQFLRWAGSAGYARGRSQTPYEFLDKVRGMLPEVDGDLDRMTGYYVQTRYGRDLTVDLQRLNQSWYQIKKRKQHLKKQTHRTGS